MIRSKRSATTQISAKNKKARIENGRKYRYKTLDSLFKWIHWTDEAYIDRATIIPKYIFREEGNYEGLIIEVPEPGHLTLYIAASISWYHKSEIYFYYDEHWEHSYMKSLWQKSKPRRNRATKTEEEYQSEVLEWKNLQPPETIKKGNTMTQHYYAQNILPRYIEWMETMRGRGYPAILMEDGDPSHGHRSGDNEPDLLRKRHWIQLFEHPAQSPDLNPIEGIWLLLEERLKQRYNEQLHSMDFNQLKAAIQTCWADIT